MIALIRFLLAILTSPFKSKSRLEAENAALRQQLVVLQRKVKSRVALSNGDRLFFVQLYQWFPSILEIITIIQPETLVRWHRAGFRRYWRWKSRRRGGRPQISTELRALIRQMSAENRLWDAPRIHGELLKLDSKFSNRRRQIHGQAPRAAKPGMARLSRAIMRLVSPQWICSLSRPSASPCSMSSSSSGSTAEPLSGPMSPDIRQRNGLRVRLQGLLPWDEAPRYLIRDRDGVFGAVVTRRLRAMGIPDKPIAPASPWQNAFAERLIGSTAASAPTISSFLARGICVGFCDATLIITTK